MNIFLRKIEACLSNSWYFCSAKVVATALDVHFPLFWRAHCVSKQFRLPLWRVKKALEPWIKSQTKTYNVLKMRLQILFKGGNRQAIHYFSLDIIGVLMHANQSCACKFIILMGFISNVIEEPDTLNLSMPLDALSLERA